jgi:hypothetical protein
LDLASYVFCVFCVFCIDCVDCVDCVDCTAILAEKRRALLVSALHTCNNIYNYLVCLPM